MKTGCVITSSSYCTQELNSCVASFVRELKRTPGLWENVAIATLSDFGRTITSNGIGTDHGWGGNHMLLGGSVIGGRIHGAYPSSLTEDSAQMLPRGRLIPTTPWCVYRTPSAPHHF
jgi:cullin-associated NEDD8-dissociated protein 1